MKYMNYKRIKQSIPIYLKEKEEKEKILRFDKKKIHLINFSLNIK